jgi:hypothetical protein
MTRGMMKAKSPPADGLLSTGFHSGGQEVFFLKNL